MVSNQIIQKCKSNNKEAQRLLYEQCAPYVYSIISSYITIKEDHKDVMQEVFIAVFRSLERFDSNLGKFKSWISQITTFKCIDHLKKRNDINFSTDLVVIEHIDESQMRLLNQFSEEDIRAMLKNMPTGYRTVFLMKIIDEYSHVEIAEILKISVETSRSQLSRAISWIKKNIINKSKPHYYGTL